LINLRFNFKLKYTFIRVVGRKRNESAETDFDHLVGSNR